MRCLVVYNLSTETVDFFWWCEGSEYIEMRGKLSTLYPASDYEITTEYEQSPFILDNALGY